MYTYTGQAEERAEPAESAGGLPQADAQPARRGGAEPEGGEATRREGAHDGGGGPRQAASPRGACVHIFPIISMAY